MRILFLVIGNSRRSNYLNGDTIRTGGGGASGTDTSNILIAEYLASQGHEIVLCSEKLEPALEEQYRNAGSNPPQGEFVRGVQYTDMEFNGVENKTFDILINNLWFSDYNKLPIAVTKAVVYWSHMQWIYGVRETIEYVKENNLKLGIVNISLWEKEMNFSTLTHFIKSVDTTAVIIPNPVADDIITEVKNKNIVKKPGKFVFHAAWARGGNVALDAVRNIDIPDKEFHSFDYLMATHAHTDDYFNLHNGVDKTTLFTHIAEAEYFFYPLYTPYHDVHKDTFSCVVAEAIALGTVPITYPLGALPENFTGYCQWSKFPEGVNPLELQKEPLSKDEEEVFNNSKYIVDAYKQSELDTTLKQHVQQKGYDYILSNFSISKVGEKWIDFINRL